MIIKEFFRTRKDGISLYRTYSDANMIIRKVGTTETYDEAIDVDGAPWVYEETDMPIERIEPLEPTYQDGNEDVAD